MEGESALIDAIYMLLPALEFNMTVNSNTPTLPVMKKYCVRIHIQSNCGSKSSDFSFTLDGFPKLKSFSVESNSLKQCASLIIRDNPLLKSVKVDSNCFMKAGSSLGALEITACPALAIISIGENSFNHATNVILHTLPSLVFFEFYATNFVDASYFSLWQLDRFETLVIPPNSMNAIRTIQLISLPVLRKIILGKNCWIGSKKQSEMTCKGRRGFGLVSRLPQTRNDRFWRGRQHDVERIQLVRFPK